MLQHDKPKIGVYICHCGMNIAPKVDVEEVVRYSQTLDHVAVARDYEFMCSNPGQELIVNDIKTYGLNRIVEASCSPRMHEATFQKACEQAGLNPYYLQMANIREQSSWVTLDTIEATAKAKDLVAAAVMRVVWHAPLETREVAVKKSVLIIGGGIAGMQAALTTAEAGFDVYLVEREPSIGGHMLRFDKTFPTLDCAACIGTPKMVSVVQDPNIELFTYSEVKEISGFVGNFKVTVNKNARYVNNNCTGCGECEQVCPVELPSEWDVGTKMRQAIYRPFPQAVPITYTIDKMSTAPCTTSCPAGTNVHGYVQMVKVGNYQQALNIIMERLPLPGVLGRVCPHPCENECRRSLIDSPISIRELKRFAADNARLEDVPLPEVEERDEKIAVIGSGPAGLTVAYYLRLKGFQVTVYEALEKPGGMLRTGIPDYRLPPKILDQEIDHILSTGIELKTGMALGDDFTLASLKDQGFDAIFLGIGAHLPIKMNIENEDIDGVVDAIPFLHKVNLEGTQEAQPRAAVIGGGNVAMDAARAAIRSGAEKVTVVYRRTEHEMPAYQEEIEGAKEEGVEFIYLASPVKAVQEQGRVVGIECIKNELGPADESGRRRPIPVEGSEFVVECDMIIPAIGQRAETEPIVREKNIDLTAWGTFKVDHLTMQTSEAGVFAAGDAVTGPATVIEAVAAGHKVVKAIERYLNKEMEKYDEEREEKKAPVEKNYAPVPEDALIVERAKPGFLDVKARENSYKEVDLGLDETSALSEAEKCINCSGCCECKRCESVCKPEAIDHSMEDKKEIVDVGSIIVATGYKPFDPTPLEQYGYGRFPEVYTSMQFERLNNATGPTGGQIVMKNGRPPRKVAIIHCVGSRDLRHRKYCSRVCCMYSMKFAHLIREKIDAEVWEFYIDIRSPGKLYEEFYNRVQEEGVHFVRGKVAEVTDIPETPADKGRLIVVAENTLTRRTLRIPVDMVILSVGLEPAEGSEEIGRITGVSRDQDGWFNELHAKLAPVSTPVRGIFLAGCCQGPKDIPDTVAQSLGAAGEAIALLSKGTVRTRAAISYIDPDLCAGCQSCIQICAYSAIHFDAAQSISKVNEALCQGCGSCSAVCPSNAAGVRHFTNRQVMGEIEALLL
jgi:heterodisulfide reductase subunit A